MSENPFKYKGSLSPEDDKDILVKRTEAETELIRCLLRGEYISIIGPRQIGKTTLLKQLPLLLEDEMPGHLYIFVDLQMFGNFNLEQTYQKLGELIRDQLPEKLQDRFRLTDDPGDSIDFKKFVADMCKDYKQNVILVLDEFEGLSKKGRGNANDLLSCLRAIKNDTEKIFNRFNLIISGHMDLYEFGNLEGSPFYNVSIPIKLKDFSHEDTLQLGSLLFKQLGISPYNKIIDIVFEKTRGYPYLVQKIFSYLFDISNYDKRGIDVDLLNDVIEEIIMKRDDLEVIMLNGIEENGRLFDIIVRLLESRDGVLDKKEFDESDCEKLCLLSAVSLVKHEIKFRNPIIERKLRNYFTDSKKAAIYTLQQNLYAAAGYLKKIKQYDPVKKALQALNEDRDTLDIRHTYDKIAIMAILYFNFDRARVYVPRKINPDDKKKKTSTFSLVINKERDNNDLNHVRSFKNEEFHDLELDENENEVMQWVLRNRQQRYIPDAEKDPSIDKETWKIFKAKSPVFSPLTYKGEVISILVTDKQITHNPITDEELTQLDEFLQYASLHLHDKRARELQVIIDYGKKLNCIRKEKDIIGYCMSVSMKLLPQTDKVTFRIKKGDELHRIGHKGIKPGLAEIIKIEDRTITGLVAREQKPILLNDVHESPDYIDSWEGANSELTVPVINHDQVIGVLNHECGKKNAYSQADLKLLMNLVDQTALAIINARKFVEADNKLLSLAEIIRLINNTDEPESIFALVMDKAIELTVSTYGHLYMYELPDHRLRLIENRGDPSPDEYFDINIKTKGLIRKCAEYKQVINCPDVSKEPDYLETIRETKSELVIPILINKTELKGILNLESDEPDHFTEDIEKLMETYADHIAVTFSKIERQEELKKTRYKLALRSSFEADEKLAIAISHTLKNKINYIPLHMDYIKKNSNVMQNPECREMADEILEGIHGASRLIRAISKFYKKKEKSKKQELLDEIDINEIIEDVLEEPEYRCNGCDKIQVNRKFGKKLPRLQGNSELLRYLFGNIYFNAIQAIEIQSKKFTKGLYYGIIVIETRVDKKGGIVVIFKDNGCGISEKNIKTIRSQKEPGFTTKADTGGTGFGIWSVNVILGIFNGSLDIKSKEGTGTIVTIQLPVGFNI